MNPQSGHTKHTEETKLEQASDTLSQLPRKPRSRRAQVEYLQASILDALDKGYSYSEVSALLAEQEIDIDLTFRQAMTTGSPLSLSHRSRINQWLNLIEQEINKAGKHLGLDR
jgi:hypothetical protein